MKLIPVKTAVEINLRTLTTQNISIAGISNFYDIRLLDVKPLPSNLLLERTRVLTFKKEYLKLLKYSFGLTLSCFMVDANAALVSPCAGVSLQPSVVTDIVGAAVLPVTGILDGGLSILLGPLGLSSNLTNTLGAIAAGDPINLNALDVNGNIVSPSDDCNTSADSYTLDTPKGLSIGGNQITGLGSGPVANAGELNSIALGNNASTNALATNSIAIGTNAAVGGSGANSIAIGSGASANVANSIAIGTNSAATIGAESNYSAYGLVAPQNSVGEVSVGTVGSARKITNVAAGSNGTDAVNVSQLQAVDDGAVKYDPLSLKMTVTLGGPVSNDGGISGGTRITNLSQGAITEFSTDAVNGSQIFNITDALTSNIDALGTSMATNLGGGAIYNSTTGIVSSPTYNVYGTTQTNVGNAINAIQTESPIQFSDANGVVTPNTKSNDIVLVGSNSDPVRIHNVAAGIAPTDVVNVSQLQAVDDGAVKYDPLSLKMTVTLEGPLSNDGGTTGGTKITNLSKGDISEFSTDAVNGSQLFNITNGFTSNIDALGTSMATNLGGGAIYNATTGIVSAPSYNVYGTLQSSVGGAIDALQAESPIQYSDANGVVTNTKSNDITLVGSTADPVRIHNVAAGIAPTDAVNVSQLNAIADDIDDLDALAVKYDGPSQDSISLNGTTSADGGVTGGTLVTNLQQGAISVLSTDAVNGAQLFATNQMIMNISNGTGLKYFQVNSNLTDALATGNDSMAIGPESLASGTASIAMGLNSQARNAGAIAIGQNSLSSGINSIAIGTGAVATGSVAVGAGAQAGNGGAAFGDNAFALVPLQGTAVGNGAVVTSDRGVALGAGSTATRAGMNGATERFSNTSVTSTEGAVSVGSAGNERQITNVAGGTADTDAVNVRQLEAAMAQSSMDIDNQLNALKSDIGSLRHDANAGTAAAMALASMPQSVIPGKAMLAAGLANYEGQSAMSIGVSNFSENGRWVINFNGSANTRGRAGAGVGVGFHW